jgi:hypothetical protein
MRNVCKLTESCDCKAAISADAVKFHQSLSLPLSEGDGGFSKEASGVGDGEGESLHI